MRKSVEAQKLNIYKTFNLQPSLTFIETQSPSKSTERFSRQSKIVFKNGLSEKSVQQNTEDKIEKLQQLCHKYELEFEERTLKEQNLCKQLATIKRKYQEL